MDAVWFLLALFSAVVLIALIVTKIYVENFKGKCTSHADMSGKTVLITGANTGIGYYTALDLARRNARVILACRDKTKGQAAVNGIVSATGNQNVRLGIVDLSIMKSVRDFATQFLQEEARLDVLVNNAGMAGLPLTMTEEGFEMMFAVNYFGPFLLTNLLLDLLKKSSPSRIVNVSSSAHSWTKVLDFDNMKAEKSYDIAHQYAETKVALNLFTRELALRLENTGVTTYIVHPGVVTTELWRHVPPYIAIFLVFPKYFYFKTGEEGAQTTIYCAVSEEVAEHSGKYYVDCKEAENKCTDLAKDMGLAKKLWEVSEKYTAI